MVRRSLPLSLVVPMHRGTRGVDDPGQRGHPAAAVPHVHLRRRARRRPTDTAIPGFARRSSSARPGVAVRGFARLRADHRTDTHSSGSREEHAGREGLSTALCTGCARGVFLAEGFRPGNRLGRLLVSMSVVGLQRGARLRRVLEGWSGKLFVGFKGGGCVEGVVDDDEVVLPACC